MRFYRFKPAPLLFKSSVEDPAKFRGDEYIEKLKELRKSKVEAGKKVIIIGAGIAGLSAGHELKKLGYNVTLLEAQDDHIGGRLRTWREGDLHAELGAMRIPKSHTLTRLYISEQGLKLRPFVQDSKKTFSYIRGHRFQRTDEGIQASKRLFNLSDVEKGKNLSELWTEAVLGIISNFTKEEREDIFSVTPTTDKIKQLDRSSLNDAFKKAGLSEEASEYVLTHFGLETYLQTSLAEHIREEMDATWDPTDFAELENGTDSLATAVYEHLKKETIISAKVFKIHQNENTTDVYYKDAADKEVKVTGDWVICTAPLGLVSKMDVGGALSPQKIRAIRRVNYDSSTKIVVKTRNRFWELKDGIFGGGTIYDGPAGHTWYPSDNSVARDPKVSNSPSFLLASYTWGQQARRVDALPEEALKAFVLKELRKVHPYVLDEDIIGLRRWSWTTHPWSSGAFAFFNPGEHQFLYKELKTPDGKVLLAGEHCSLTHSWIQGSLESTIDACTYIVNNS
ncbi:MULTISPECIES: FAD-dependent oxidoreductase [unclassified Mucilaginibacter]|uniref:flavin monoamine oxidase family protein n=1 Tax=unclassified Mucilaginibacter TaxID=2617802 RepID=UPI002AC9D4FB|nr:MULTISPECIES: FAD-dependent oxidoreductase [unclassified Mucilaginibacter]MEB0260964.1 FAD-dependent oxidoreductase [Mucilaginibacter sp. 10I4]MEB0279559.1 FAD-dependent oxidoreductase [Mucilaginibacter sp. 10B2]MEB0302040.1 FAD-dependent oxidoreductase [Mucilaginibacter sp. 5C4]WPX22573.1 FAD-dependent oxidoreductase [Mucilaginibacter sp. 5C4]